MMRPLASVVVPVYNGERFLAEALDSCLVQDYEPFEVIVVDDGSTDDTARIAKRHARVQYVSQRHQGLPATYNSGIAVAQGELIAFLDADDLWPSDRLTLQVGYHLEHPDVGYTVGRHRAFLEPGVTRPVWLRERFLTADEVGYFPGTLMARKDVFEAIGGFRDRYRGAPGADWFVRAKDAGIRKAILSHRLLYRRIHESNMSSGESKHLNANILRILKESLDRGRAERGA